jgi:retinol dehydrogenase 12
VRARLRERVSSPGEDDGWGEPAGRPLVCVASFPCSFRPGMFCTKKNELHEKQKPRGVMRSAAGWAWRSVMLCCALTSVGGRASAFDASPCGACWRTVGRASAFVAAPCAAALSCRRRLPFASTLAASGAADVSNVQGKVVLVTGCNSGMGAATAKAMLQGGAHVIAVSRNPAATTSALEPHGRQVPTGNVQPRSFASVDADLLSLASVRSAAAAIKQQYGAESIDALVANAGIMAPPFARTEDGFESQMQVNFLSQFLLLRLLAAETSCFKTRKASAKQATRIIQITSLSSEKASLADGGLTAVAAGSAETYNGMTAYRLSKLAQVLSGPEIASRLDLLSYSVHPGVVNTPLFNRNVSPVMRPLVVGFAAVAGALGAVNSPEKGAETAVFLASSSQPATPAEGLYWADCRQRDPNPELYDAALRDRIWTQVGTPRLAYENENPRTLFFSARARTISIPVSYSLSLLSVCVCARLRGLHAHAYTHTHCTRIQPAAAHLPKYCVCVRGGYWLGVCLSESECDVQKF